ncbi:MAG: tricarballylate utilization 4Fe-4S protein TcuB [archaeon]|nr:tricarballylate utilization 4Fe-4S protein TcuB [archaeon]
MSALDIFKEGARQFTICNACRYCEGFCPVWPVMERRTQFGKNDLYYMANICHDCKACYYACPYTEPNEQKVNIPEILSRLRLASYKEYATPRFLSGYFGRHKEFFAFTAIASVFAITIFALLIGDPTRLFTPHPEAGSFYDIFPYFVIVTAGVIIGVYVISNYLYNIVRFYKAIKVNGAKFSVRAALVAASDVFWHNGFKGGWLIKDKKAGCYHEETTPSYTFLMLHALIFYGFIAALISTIIAAIYQDVFAILPPYPVLSLPVFFGIVGGICMTIGTLAFFVLQSKPDIRPIFKNMSTLDHAFLFTLALVSITGFLTLIFRSSALLGMMFTFHLGFVLLLFVTAPYGKFVHFTYRYTTLVVTRIEERKGSVRQELNLDSDD